MSAALQYPHILFDPGGIAYIANSRYKVLHLAGEHFHYGWSAEELLRQHPDLKPEEVYAALTYFYDHYNEICDVLRNSATSAEGQKVGQTLSREELLRRKKLTEPG